MPFGIKSAPEIFQRKMHELIEGLNGVEVIADDFLVVGYGDSLQAASKDHDKSLSAFLQRCEERGICLNGNKFRMKEVLFTGHVATSECLRADPAKVRAIREMPDLRMLQVCSVSWGWFSTLANSWPDYQISSSVLETLRAKT